MPFPSLERTVTVTLTETHSIPVIVIDPLPFPMHSYSLPVLPYFTDSPKTESNAVELVNADNHYSLTEPISPVYDIVKEKPLVDTTSTTTTKSKSLRYLLTCHSAIIA